MIEELRGDALQRVARRTEVDHERTAAPAALNHDPRRGNTSKHKVGATTGATAVTSFGRSNVRGHASNTGAATPLRDKIGITGRALPVNGMRLPVDVREQICITLEGIHGHSVPVQAEHIC